MSFFIRVLRGADTAPRPTAPSRIPGCCTLPHIVRSRSIAGVIVLMLGVLPGCAASDRTAREAAQRDYARLSGTWRLMRAVVDGTPVPEPQVRQTILITDGNTFRFPQAAGVGTHPAGTFTINPRTI